MIESIKSRIPQFIKIIFPIYIFGLIFFQGMRFLLIILSYNGTAKYSDLVMFDTFRTGLLFDNVILAYALSIPILLLFIKEFFQIKHNWISYSILWYFGLTTPLIILITFVDIPYFLFFENRLSEVAFQWLSTPKIVFEMILSNTTNMIFSILALIMALFSLFIMRNFIRRYFQMNNEVVEQKKWSLIVGFLTLGFLCFAGMRGKKTHPIRLDDAFHSTDLSLNQLTLNPCFSLFKSYYSKVDLMDNIEAIDNVKEILKIQRPLKNISPIARWINPKEKPKKPNIVLVLMESMSANYLSYFGNRDALTPNLDSLIKKSWFFENAYSAGIHTNNGVFSTLYSYPAIDRTRPMAAIPFNTYSGMPFTLKKTGYRTEFYTSHDKRFDNLGTFMPKNFIDELISETNYPIEKSIGPYGIADDYLYEFAVDKLSKNSDKKPFFATILTTSNHDPYILPDYFIKRKNHPELDAVAYADWSIGEFLKRAKKTDWFENTIFVFVADHGRKVESNKSPVDLSFNHVPIIFYAPKILDKPQIISNFIGQIDIFPTLMGILNFNYINNTLGVDVINQPRDCIFYSMDDKICCIDRENLYVNYFGTKDSFLKLSTGEPYVLNDENTKQLNHLKKVVTSNTQAAEWLISNQRTQIK